MQIKTKNIPLPTSFGKNLRYLRRVKGISQAKLATELGLKRNNITSYESGIVEPKATTFLKVCTYFDIEPEVMLQSTYTESSLSKANENNQRGIIKDYIAGYLTEFIVYTNELTKIHEGYQQFQELRTTSVNTPLPYHKAWRDMMSLIKFYLNTNWSFIQSFSNNEEE